MQSDASRENTTLILYSTPTTTYFILSHLTLPQHLLFIWNIHWSNIATPIHQLPLSERFNEAIRWLENEGKGETIGTTTRTYSITEHLQIQALRTKIRRQKKVQARTTLVEIGPPTLLTEEERLTIIQYIQDQALRSSIRATKDIVRNAINCLRRAKGKGEVSKT